MINSIKIFPSVLHIVVHTAHSTPLPLPGIWCPNNNVLVTWDITCHSDMTIQKAELHKDFSTAGSSQQNLPPPRLLSHSPAFVRTSFQNGCTKKNTTKSYKNALSNVKKAGLLVVFRCTNWTLMKLTDMWCVWPKNERD